MKQITLADLERMEKEANEDSESFKQYMTQKGEDVGVSYSMYLTALGEALAYRNLAKWMKDLGEREYQLQVKHKTLFKEGVK
jgi:hypothetical protein